jgi:hypothetical protein
MYLIVVAVSMFLAPLVSVAAEYWSSAATFDLLGAAGKWLTFWAVGVRLFLTGINQAFRPGFTARGIFGVEDPRALGLAREIGFGNVAIGALGLASLPRPEWTIPAAAAGGIFYGLAGFMHVAKPERNAKEGIALVSDLLVFAVLAAFIVFRGGFGL